MQVITDACIKIAAVELCFEKKTKESVVETFKKYFAGFCQKILGKKNISEDISRKIDKKLLSHLVDFSH